MEKNISILVDKFQKRLESMFKGNPITWASTIICPQSYWQFTLHHPKLLPPSANTIVGEIKEVLSNQMSLNAWTLSYICADVWFRKSVLNCILCYLVSIPIYVYKMRSKHYKSISRLQLANKFTRKLQFIITGDFLVYALSITIVWTSPDYAF